MSPYPSLIRAVRKLEQHSELADADRAAILALPFAVRVLEPGSYIIREGDRPEHCVTLLSGFAIRHKVTGDGRRQIIAIHMPGELVDLHNLFLETSDHNIQALTRLEAAFVPRSAARELALGSPAVGRALWADTLIDASIFREWVVNVGRRDSLTRIAHLLCEFALRLEAAGLGGEQGYEMPMTQEQIADCTGLTPVHVNRVLKELGELGLIVRNKRSISIPDWARLSHIGDFTARYLHLDQSGGARRAA
jgi:CRP-like cAMP-binding protein